MSSFAEGAALLLGGLLVAAGLMKLASPAAFAHSLHRLLPESWAARSSAARSSAARAAAPAIGLCEAALGGLLLVAAVLPRPAAVAVTVAAAGLYLAFVAVVVVAIGKGSACGCFASFSDGPAAGAELGRALSLAGIAATTAAISAAGSGPRWHALALGWLAALVAAVVLSTGLGSRLLPAPRRYRRLELPAARLRRWVAFLFGRVTSYSAAVPLPRERRIGAEERGAAIAAARRAPSVVAFVEWLGERSAALGWDAAGARATSVESAGGESVPAVVLRLPPAGGLAVTVTVLDRRGTEDEAIVRARVDGRLVMAIGGHVHDESASTARTRRDGAG